jgi:spore germination protein KC
VSLLVAGTAFLSLPRVVAVPAGPGGWLGVALGCLWALPAGWLLFTLYARHPGATLVGTGRQLLGPFLGNLLGLGLVAWGHFYLGVLVREFAGVFLIAFLTETPLSALLVVIVTLLVYAAYQGMEAIVRTAQVFIPLIALSLVVILGGLAPRFNPGHLLPLTGTGWHGVSLASLFTVSLFAQGLAATAFFPFLRQARQARPAVLWGYGVAGAVFLLLTVVELGAFSAGVLTSLAVPTLAAARVVRVGLFFERFEAGFMVVWFVLSFLKLALFFFFTTTTLAEVLGLPSQKPLCFPGGLIVAFTALFPDNFTVLARLVDSLYRYGFAAFAIPAALLLASFLRRRRPGKLVATVLALCLALGVSGCWSRRELEDLSFVLALGVDEASHGKVRLVIQAALPSRLSAGGKGEGGGGGGGSGATGPVWIATTEGPTVFAALRDLEKRASDRVFLAHARVLLISEQVGKSGIGPLLDYAYREPQIRETVDLVVTPEPPEDVLKAIPSQEKIPVLYLNNLLEHARLHGTSAPLDLLGYRVYHSLPGAAVALPRLRLYRPPGAKPEDKPSEFILDGLAVFRQDRLVGYLPLDAVPGVLWLTGRAKSLPVTFHDPADRNSSVSVEVLHARCTRRLVPDRAQPERTLLKLEVEGEANLREVASYGRSRTTAEVRALDRALSQAVAHQVWHSLTAARRLRADIFGLAEEAREALPAEDWQDYGRRWPDTFSRCPVDVRVDLRLRRRGMTF